MTPRTQLLAEARGWRGAAEIASGIRGGTRWQRANVLISVPMDAEGETVAAAAKERKWGHLRTMGDQFLARCGKVDAEARRVVSLACLFMALECEDEAQALAPRRGTKKKKGAK